MLVLEPIEWLGMVATRLDRSVTSDDSRNSSRVAPTALSRLDITNHLVRSMRCMRVGATRRFYLQKLGQKDRSREYTLIPGPIRHSHLDPV
jgi:hypothetical protein